MDRETYEALRRLLAELGEVNDGEVYSSQGWDLDPSKLHLFDDLGRVYGWVDEVAKEYEG